MKSPAASTWEEVVHLTLDQKQRLERLDARWRKRWQELNTRIDQTQEALTALLRSSSPDMHKVKVLIKRQMDYQAEVQIGGIEAGLSQQQVLTAKQRELLAQWQASAKKGACGCGGSAASEQHGSGCGGGNGGCGGSHARTSAATTALK